MKKLITLLAFLCWQTTNAQEKSLLLQATSFSIPDDGYIIEPELTFSLEDEFSFHEFSINSSGSFCTLNGIVTGNNYPYIYLSYNPFNSTSYSSMGVSRDVNLGKKIGAIAYFEIGIDDADFKNWSIGAGMIYSFEFPTFKRRR